MTKSDDFEKIIKKIRKDRTLVQNEKGNIKCRKDYTKLEKFRIWLNKWWVFFLVILAIVQIINMIVNLIKK